MNTKKTILLILAAGLLLSCDNASNEQPSLQKSQDSSTDEGVIATIDDLKIHASQLDAVLVEMFGEYKASQMDSESRKRALDSMLAAYALSKKATQFLPEKRLNEIEEKTRRYRENLLISTYMQTKMDASAVSSEKVKAYYQQNLEKFGGSTIKQYRLLTTRNELLEETRDKFLATVTANKKSGTLQEMKKALEVQGFEMLLQSGVLDESALDNRLRQFIQSQAVETRSEIIFIDNKPYIVMVTSQKTLKAKPLEEVKDLVRRTLALQELKGIIKKHSAEALADSKIIYSNPQKDMSK